MEIPSQKSFTLLPCCGSLEPDYETFQYFPLNIWEHGIDIISPPWLTRCHILKASQVVNLHLSCRQGHNTYAQGVVESIQNKVYRLRFVEGPQFSWPLCLVTIAGYVPTFQTDFPLDKLYRKFFKDSLLLKKGIAVYLKHLNAYFSRVIGDKEASYAKIGPTYFEQTFKVLHHKIQRLTAINNRLEVPEDTCSLIQTADFLELHDLLQSEVDLDLVNLALRGHHHLSYVLSIKMLEEKLYWNYNGMLIIYDHLLKKPGESKSFKEMAERSQRKEFIK